MANWEFKVVVLPRAEPDQENYSPEEDIEKTARLYESTLQALGNERWELVTVAGGSTPIMPACMAFLKRERT